MSVEIPRRLAPHLPAARCPPLPHPEPHPVLVAQQAFAADAADVLRRAGTSGQRLTTALFLILAEHAATPVTGNADDLHLRCRRCRPENREPAAQYPCTTAQQAYWALDAALG